MDNAKQGTTKRWSFSTGQRGVNRVRVFEHPVSGLISTEIYEGGRAKRIALGHRDRERAKGQAEEMAVKLRQAVPVTTEHTTLEALFDNYLRERTPQKAPTTQQHDRACALLFKKAFGGATEARNLSRREWDRFIRDRRSGRLRPGMRGEARTVRDRVIAYDLLWLRAVLRWATQTSDGRGGTLLDRNPLAGLELPREESPRRPILGEKEYQAISKVAADVDPQFALAFLLAHETGHRLNSIRQQRWSNIDLARSMIRWPAEQDKIHFEHETPMSSACLAALKQARRQQPFGDGWLFPARRLGKRSKAPDRPQRRELFNAWWDAAEKKAKVVHVPGRQWHSLRRKFASEIKQLPLKDQCALGGWKDAMTIVKCYHKADEATMREGLAQRQTLREAADS